MGNVEGHGYESKSLTTNYCVNHDLVPSSLFDLSFSIKEGEVCPWTVVLYIGLGIEYIKIILKIHFFLF